MNFIKLKIIALGISTLAGGVIAAEPPVAKNALQGKNILFVVGDSQKGVRNDDPLIKEYLESKGANVSFAKVDDSSPGSIGKDLIIISSTAKARELGSKYKNVKIPVVTWNAYTFADMDMTGNMLHRDFSVVSEKKFHNSNHALFYAYATSETKPIIKAAGIPHGIFAPLTFSAGETDPSWGKPTLGGDVDVTFEGSDEKAGVFSYEKGSLMNNDFPAPARRVGLFLGDNTFTVLTDATGTAALDPKSNAWFAGRRIFDAAIRWAVSPVQQPPQRIGMSQANAELSKSLKGKNVLFVRRMDMPWPDNESSDQAHMQWLKSLGINLKVVDHMEPDTQAEGMDLVIVSAAINKYKLGNKYSDVKVPVVLLEGKAVDSMNMVARSRNTHYGVNDHKASIYPAENYVTLVRPSHELSAGFPAGQFKMYKNPGVLAWTVPPAGAEVIASIPNQPQHATMFSYEKDAVMANDHIAPARRVLFPMDTTMFAEFTDEGRYLYGTTLAWAASKK